LALLSGRGGVEFMGFLLASSQPLLHAEAAAALAALRRAARHTASADAPPTLPPPASDDGAAEATSPSAASAAQQALPLSRGALCCDPMAVGACVGAGDGATEQSLADRLAAIRSAGGAGGLSAPARRRFEDDLAFLLADN
jgi:hypothetical protein